MSSPTEPWERKVSVWMYYTPPEIAGDLAGGEWSILNNQDQWLYRDQLLTEQYKEGAD